MEKLPNVQAEQVSEKSFQLSIGEMSMVFAGQFCQLTPRERRECVAILLSTYSELLSSPTKANNLCL